MAGTPYTQHSVNDALSSRKNVALLKWTKSCVVTVKQHDGARRRQVVHWERQGTCQNNGVTRGAEVWGRTAPGDTLQGHPNEILKKTVAEFKKTSGKTRSNSQYAAITLQTAMTKKVSFLRKK